MATLLLSAVHEDVATFLLARLRALVEAADRCLISALGKARPVAPLRLVPVDLMIENGGLLNQQLSRAIVLAGFLQRVLLLFLLLVAPVPSVGLFVRFGCVC